MPWLGLGETTSSIVIVPVTVPLADAGQSCVPAGPGFVLLPHSQMTIPPFTDFCPKWMCACVGPGWAGVTPSRSEKRSS